MINIGSKQLKGISVGNRVVKEVYKGSQKIWSSASWKTIYSGSIDNSTWNYNFIEGNLYRITFTAYGTTNVPNPWEFEGASYGREYTATNSGRDGIGNKYSVSGKLILNPTNITTTRNSTYGYTAEGNQYTIYGGFIVTKVEEFS